METSKLTSKGQMTIPVALRKAFDLSTGDEIAFELKGNAIMLRKVKPLDIEYYKAIEASFSSEWHSTEDAEAFDDL